MGGSSGPRTYSSYKQDLESITQDADDAVFKTELGNYLIDQLKSFNNRDVDFINERLDEMMGAIEDGTDSIRMVFGGSVAKHTYVDGLSDIDVLMPVNATEFDGNSPESIKEAVAERLVNALGAEVTVKTGTLAVTVQYNDGMEIQVLPAIKTEDGIKIPNRSGDRWSSIDPSGFTTALSRANDALGMKLVPTIKLVKAINSTLPKATQLSGYHIESLAIKAFKGYAGERTPEAMTRHFFRLAKDLVLSPIKDKTGQSLHVDQYLGAARSRDRKVAHAVLDRIDRRLTLADKSNDLSRWQEFFE